MFPHCAALFSLSRPGKLQSSTSVSGKQSNNGKYEWTGWDQPGRYLFWLSRLKLTKYWPLSLNKIWMGDIRSNISGGRRADIVIILCSFCSLFTGLLSEVAWKIISDKNDDKILFLSLPLTSRAEKYCLLSLKECFELDENSWIHWGSWYHLEKEKISMLQL